MREIRTLRCDVEGTGNVAWSRYCDTRRRKSELTVNTNFDLNRRASPRPYLREAGGAIPSAYSPNLRKTAPQRRFMPKLPIRHRGYLAMARFKVHREPRRRGGSFAPVRRQEVAVGMKFGSLTVVACVGVLFNGRSTRVSWLCQCDQCRRRVIVAGSQLRDGRSPCGCLRVASFDL